MSGLKNNSVGGQKTLALQFHPRFLLRYGILPAIIAMMFLAFGFAEPRFHSLENVRNILIQSSYLAILATGQLFALITRGFDLSVGEATSMISVLCALVMTSLLTSESDGIVQAVIVTGMVGLLLGGLVGAINGICVSVFRISPFLVTLGVMGICQGVATTASGGFPVFDLPTVFIDVFSRASLLGIPVPVIGCALVALVAHLILARTVLGRTIYILGSNPRAAHVAGMASRTALLAAYVICSILVAVAALLLTARAGSGQPNLGGGLMLHSIAAAVIGGVSLRGGEGQVYQVVAGAIFVAMLSIGMNLIRVDGYIQQIVLGAVVVGAVYLDKVRTYLR